MSTRQSVFNQTQGRPAPSLSNHSTYHPGGYGVSEGLKRARRPFAVRNAIVGTTLVVTAVNLYLYSIYKIKQDDFSDIGVPAGPATATVPAPVNTAASANASNTPAATAAPNTSTDKRIV